MKSNKKLLAIITLAAFMMMLVPFAAFAAEGNRYASSFSIDKTSAIADGADYIEATVYVASATGAEGLEEVIFTTNRGAGLAAALALDTFASADAAKYPEVAGFVQTGAAATAYEGKAVIRLTSTTKGAAKVAAAVSYDSYGAPGDIYGSIAAHKTAVQDYLNGDTTYTAAQLNIIATYDVTFTSPSAGSVTLSAAPAVDPVANGVAELTIVATVTGGVGGTGAPVSDAVVTFGVNKTGLTWDKTEYKTDAMGRVTAKVTTTKAADYNISASVGSVTSAVVTYTFAADATPYNIEITKETSTPIAKGVNAAKIVSFKVTDINGNKISTGGVITPEVKTKPTGSTAAIPAFNSMDANNYYRYDFNPDKEGTYTLRFKLANGRFVDTQVTAQTQGTVTGLTIAFDEKSLTIPNTGTNTTTAPTVKQVDANGVTKTVALPGNITFSSSNPAVAVMSGITSGAVVTNTTDAKDAQIVTITAIDTVNNLVATTELPLVGVPVGVKADTPAPVAVNTKATFNLTFVDKNGNTVALGANPTSCDYTVTSKPAGAGVDVSYAATKNDDLKNTGATTVTVCSTVAGTVQVMLRITEAGGQIYTVPVTAVFAAPKVVVGAAQVTMFIGATGFVQDGTAKVTDVAPFIKDGRTFVAVRPLGDAFGAAIGWDEATQTVTLTRDDMTLTIVIGSNTITKVADGVTSTVTADVPAFIQDGRTVLPFRAVGEAFGASVSYDAATQAVSFLQ